MATTLHGSFKDRMTERLTPYVLLFPAIAIVAGVLGYAVVRGIVMSFYQIEVWEPGEPFVGLANYRDLFTSPGFRNSLVISLIFVGATIVIGLLMSLVHALVLNQIKFARAVFRAIALIPYLVSGVAAAVMWRFLFTGQNAIVTQISGALGGSTVSWLADPDKALMVITMANVWFIAPFATLILLAGLQTIDPEMYAAAEIDGAGSWQKFVHITIPSIVPMLSLALMWLSFASFNMFDIILPLTGGGPGRSTEVLAVYMYQLAFRDLNYSTGAAVMIVILVINIALSAVFLRAAGRSRDDK
ncbi:carbohydrate ABC transporter permease [Roseicitreum antarcticum]|uniref:Multiple sugar transport system permease protein n=1 Tax=Roseicitreum antarcticum TaxID=564137 RepID=A0A1H3FFN4_9RHOB|nr:sugar ABC transporter permease [Roseicitreum antarcticum]SDX89685.1 multiple sugar transport system permease protein [Roseicitreum antarcticum]